MSDIPLFDQLVLSEFALRAESIHRRQFVMLNGEEHSVKNPDAGTSREEVAQHLYEQFIHIHDFMSLDSSQHHKNVGGVRFNTRHLKNQDREEIHRIFEGFVEKHYDGQGNITLSAQSAPAALQDLYEQMSDRTRVPLHGTELAMGALFVELGRGDKWQESINKDGIDFTRAEPGDNLTARFTKALSKAHDHHPETSLFIAPPESFVTIAGMRFPAKKDVNGFRTHLVTETGHLVDLTTEGEDSLQARLERHILEKKPIQDFKVFVNQRDGADKTHHLLDFKDNDHDVDERVKPVRDSIYAKLSGMEKAKSIDGNKVIPATGGLHVALMSLDVDMLTGLRMTKLAGEEKSELDRLKAFMTKQTVGGKAIKDFVDLIPESMRDNIYLAETDAQKNMLRDELKDHVAQTFQTWREANQDNAELSTLLTRTQARLEVMLPRVYEISDHAFVNTAKDEETSKEIKTLKERPTGKPHVYLSQGGGGSGKSTLNKIAKSECKDSLVTASLDDVRDKSDLYWLYPATNNHNDDYKTVEQFGNLVRDLTTRRALQGGYNLMIDGSGIPYEGRNDKVSETFKQAGYHVSVLAAQAPLFTYNPAKRKEMFEQGVAFADATIRVGGRFAETMRALIMKIVGEKHIGFPLAAANAARDKNVDRFMIQDVSGHIGEDYTLSYVITLPRKEVEAISTLEGKKLETFLEEHHENPHYVPKWVKLPHPSPDGYEPHYKLKVIRKNEDSTYRVEVITDLEQYLAMTQKGLLNRDAKGPEAWMDNKIRSDIEGRFQGEDGRLHLQSVRGVQAKEWPRFVPMFRSIEPEARLDRVHGK